MGNPNSPAISLVTVLEATWTDCPLEVQNEIRVLWRDNEFGNDNNYYSWFGDEDEARQYPEIDRYLTAHGVTKCLIHYWW